MGVPVMEPAVPFLYTVCDINHFLVVHTDNFLNLRYCEVLIKSKFYGLSDGGWKIQPICWLKWLEVNNNYHKGKRQFKFPPFFNKSIKNLIVPMINTEPPTMRRKPNMVTIIEIKKSGIILFQLELCFKFNKKNWYVKFFLSKREFFWKFCGLRKCC